MTTTARRRRSKKRFYWAEIGFLLLGLIGLKPEIITAFLPQSGNRSVSIYEARPPGSHAVYSQNGGNYFAQEQFLQAFSPPAAMHPTGWQMPPNGNAWGSASQFASYHPASAATAGSVAPALQWSQLNGAGTQGGSQSWGASSSSPPVVWPDKWGPNAAMVASSNAVPQQNTQQYHLAGIPTPSTASGGFGYYGQTQPNMAGQAGSGSPSTQGVSSMNAWNTQSQLTLVPMQQQPQTGSGTTGSGTTGSGTMGVAQVYANPSSPSNPSMQFPGSAWSTSWDGTAVAANPYGASYASPSSVTVASNPPASYPASMYPTYPTTATGIPGTPIANPSMRMPVVAVPGAATYPGTRPAVGDPNPWNQYSVPAGGSLGRY